ncbi:MAG TPA: caspase family protein, partial [Beijerinckiaceae bacterium]|nr:caspase family protein [Beijerinckiaceae bacterium]
MRTVACLFSLLALALLSPAAAQQPEKRVALVVGNAAYAAGTLATPANDAGLVAQTLQAAGFDVVGARDLDQEALRRAFRDFNDKAAASGPDTVAVIYLSGHGLQLEGENYFVPVDARIARDADVPAEALRISDFSRPLAALPLKAGMIILDAARANPFAQGGAPLAGGLALVEPEARMLLAFNAAPNTVAPQGQGAYGPYAQALAEVMREGGLPLGDMFDRVRLRVHETTKGAQVPWHVSRVEAPFVFFERTADAPPPLTDTSPAAAARARPLRDIGVKEAYALALERDSVESYSEFVSAYGNDPLARRARAMLAARREALTWRRTRVVDTPDAYWSYLRRYPRGPHAGDAQRRLRVLAAALEPPEAFAEIDYDLPPPPVEEVVYIERPVIVLDDPVFAFAPPPPAPFYLLPPPPLEFVLLPPPPPPVAVYVLPTPVYTPVPVWVRPPAYVRAPPPTNVIFRNVHNTVTINSATNTVTVRTPAGAVRRLAPPATAAAFRGPGLAGQGPRSAPRAGAALLAPTLPPSLVQRAPTIRPASVQRSGPGNALGAASTLRGQPPTARLAPGQPLPGTRGQPLPATAPTVTPDQRVRGAGVPAARGQVPVRASGAPSAHAAAAATPDLRQRQMHQQQLEARQYQLQQQQARQYQLQQQQARQYQSRQQPLQPQRAQTLSQQQVQQVQPQRQYQTAPRRSPPEQRSGGRRPPCGQPGLPA